MGLIVYFTHTWENSAKLNKIAKKSLIFDRYQLIYFKNYDAWYAINFSMIDSP